ncbi:MAG: BMP family protein [Roseburia sp.]
MKKRVMSLFLAAMMTVGLLAGCGASGKEDGNTAPAGTEAAQGDAADATAYSVAMITDYGDITDQSFNQSTYEACKAFCEENGIDFQYYKPAADSTADRVAMVEKAIDDGFNILVMPGYAFAGTVVETSEQYPDIMFFCPDVSKGDLLEAGVAAAGEEYDYQPDNWNVEDYCYMDNVYCAIYKEELAGYMAGYAAVKLGYENLGFLGGMAVPAVIRYGYGFVQGADDAAAELGAAVDVKYAYGNQFSGDADITAAMDTWYQGGTEVVFACGGGIYTSAAEAAVKVGGKVIGVDNDQSGTIDGAYGEGVTITSAMKGLSVATYDTLKGIVLDGKWNEYAGNITTLGLVSATDPQLNYLQLPMETTQWSDSFSIDDYKELVAKLYDGTIEVSNDISAEPEVTAITFENFGNLK